MKKALIVGNGKSSVNPEAKGLNFDKDVFRLNKFFLEPSLLFGRKIKFVTFPGEPYSIHLMDYLVENKIYEIETLCYRKMVQKRFFIPTVNSKLFIWNDFELKYNTENAVPGFFGVNKIDKVKKVDKVTTGPYLINMAIQMGYTEISIIGIDFYSEKSKNKYPIKIPETLKDISIFDPQFRSLKRNKKRNNSYDDNIHCIETDLEYLSSLFNKYKNIKFFIYVDEDNPYSNWKKIIKGLNNVELIMMKDNDIKKQFDSHCLKYINEALLDYKNKYFFKDKVMKIKHNWSNRKSILKKFYNYILDSF